MLKVGQRKRTVDGREEAYLVIDGEVIEDSSTYVLGDSGRFGHVYDESTATRLAKHRFEEFAAHFAKFTLWLKFEWNDLLGEVEMSFRDYDGKKLQKLRFEFRIDTEHWARPYSIAEYAEAIREETKKQKQSKVKYYEDDTEFITNGFGFECRITSLSAVVEDDVSRWSEKIKLICDAVTSTLSQSVRKNSVVTFFDFPLPVRTACEQYLLYFVQFLEDLGIKANAEIKEDARKVLFSVAPADGPRALEQIREALDIYLKLPGMPDFGSTASQHPNLAVQQLQGNILHLQSQLILAKASLQTQEATIEALQLSNFQYRQLLSSQEKPKEQSEPLIGDTVHVTKVEGKGLKVDLPVILRRLKRVLGIGGKKID